VLRHVEREELLLADPRDRGRDGDDEEHEPEREEPDPPVGNRLAAPRERSCPDAVRDRDQHDGRKLEHERHCRGGAQASA
jgi:hypothetical protein